jgi:small-conductance mechanosensitive channel
MSPDSAAAMFGSFHFFHFARFFSETPQVLLTQFQSPLFLMQIGAIVLFGLAAFWFARLIRAPLAHAALARLPKGLGPGFVRAAQYVAAPLFWFLLLALTRLVWHLFEPHLPLVSAANDLVLAWIFIRLLSFTVQGVTASIAISAAAWSIAALSILGLYWPLVGYLRTVHVYERDAQHFISMQDAVEALILLMVLLWLTRLVYRMLHRQITHSRSLTPSLQVLFTQLLQIFLPALAVIVALQSAGVDLTTLTVVFGALGLGIGLGLQRLVANLVAGLTLLAGKTIKPGDVIEYKDGYGWVTAMGARYVTLRTRDGIEHLVPNDYFLENGVQNWSHTDASLRLHVSVSISYDSDLKKALALGVEAAKSVKRVLAEPLPLCLLKGFGDSAVDLEIRLWIDDPKNGTRNVKSDVLLAVWERFNAAGIKFPYPQRDVHIVSMPEKRSE